MSFYYGVDIGGTTVKLGRFSGDGTLHEKWALPTRTGENGKYIFDDIAASILSRTVEAGGSPSQIKGVGMGIPGPILPDGCMEGGVNIGMRHVYPAKELSERLNLPLVCCGNDANVDVYKRQVIYYLVHFLRGRDPRTQRKEMRK